MGLENGDWNLRESLVPAAPPSRITKPSVEPTELRPEQAQGQAHPLPNPSNCSFRRSVRHTALSACSSRTYILLECEDAFLLIDQHAAHERLRYDALAKAVEEGVASQRLLTPQIVRVSAREMALVEENMDALSAAGYDISPIGERDLQIRAVPHINGHAETTPRFMDVIDALSASVPQRWKRGATRYCKGPARARSRPGMR